MRLCTSVAEFTYNVKLQYIQCLLKIENWQFDPYFHVTYAAYVNLGHVCLHLNTHQS